MSFKGSRGPEALWGGARGVQGAFRGLPGGSLEKLIFFFFGGEFFNGLMKYWCFHFGAILWRAWMHHMYCCFLIVFRSMLFANHWGEFSGNPCVFFNIFKTSIFVIMLKKHDEILIFWREFWGLGWSIWREIPVVFWWFRFSIIVWFLMSFVIAAFSCKIENMSFSRDVLQKLMIFDDSRDAPKGEILNISRDV